MPSRSKPLSLNSDDQSELRDISSSQSLAEGDVLRGRITLMLAAGHTYAEIQERPTISRWRSVFWNRASPTGNATCGTETNDHHTKAASTGPGCDSPQTE